MTRLTCFRRLALGLVVMALPAAAVAEGTITPDATAAVKPRHHRPVVRPVTTPAVPIPYTTYEGPTGEVAKALTPTAADIAATPDTIVSRPVETLPPPPPDIAPAPGASAEISLRCDTTTRDGKTVVSSGSFYIDLFPSPVFPDSQASFKFLLADPGHRSLVRDTMCFDTVCSAAVTGTAYYLIDRVTKKGAALRIALDRSQGAFYAEKIDGGRHLGEQGQCTPQALPAAKF